MTMTTAVPSIMTTMPSTYAQLSAPFDHTFTDVRGGVSLEYLTGEQVISRLNDVLGVAGWNFRVLEHDIHAEADEVWVLGELVAQIDGVTVTRQQFGSDKIQRSRSTGAPLDIGFDLKSAATDCLKKCATLIGVGLYLSEKKPQQRQAKQPAPARPAATRPAATTQTQGRTAPTRITTPVETTTTTATAIAIPLSGKHVAGQTEESIMCTEAGCGKPLLITERRDGTMRSPQELAEEGRAKFGKVCCASCFRKRLVAAAPSNNTRAAS